MTDARGAIWTREPWPRRSWRSKVAAKHVAVGPWASLEGRWWPARPLTRWVWTPHMCIVLMQS